MKILNKLCAFLLALMLSVCPVFAEESISKFTNGPTDANRIVITYPVGVGLLYVCGKTNNIVGANLRAMHIGIDGKLDEFYSSVSPNIAKAINLGGTGGMESVLKLMPDLVIVSDTDMSATNMRGVLAQNKIPTLAAPVMNSSVNDWLRAVDIIGKVTKTENRTNAYIAYYKKIIEIVETRVSKITERPRTAFVNTNQGNMILRGGRTRFMYSLLKIAGAKLMEAGEDPASAGACAEMLFKFDPEIIIDDSRSNEFYVTSWWKLLKPVKNGRVHIPPQDDKQAWVTNWSQPAYSPLGLIWLAKIIHPDAFSDIDLDKEHIAFKKFIYNDKSCIIPSPIGILSQMK